MFFSNQFMQDKFNKNKTNHYDKLKFYNIFNKSFSTTSFKISNLKETKPYTFFNNIEQNNQIFQFNQIYIPTNLPSIHSKLNNHNNEIQAKVNHKLNESLSMKQIVLPDEQKTNPYLFSLNFYPSNKKFFFSFFFN